MRRLTVILFGLAGAAQINRLIIILDWKFGTGQVTNSLSKSMTLHKVRVLQTLFLMVMAQNKINKQIRKMFESN